MIFRVGPCEDGKRLDSFLRSRGVSRRLINSLKHLDNGMTRRGETVRTVDRVFAGDEINLYEPSQVRSSEDTGVPVLYEDEHCIVFSKPAFMPCHRSPKHYDDTLEIEFHKLFPELPMRCINRLDKNTSGCVIAAKTLAGASWLQRSVSKVYVGITKHSGLAGGRICAPIAREEGSTVKRCVRADGKFAATTFKTVENMVNASGAGDSFFAAIIYGNINNLNENESLELALAAGNITIKSKETISSELSIENLKNIVKEENS